MAASMTTDFAVQVAAPVAMSAHVRSNRRHTMPEAGHALEILGHAIEHLTDELVHSGQAVCANNSELEAVQLLMALNRQVYYECPEVVTVSARLRSLLHLRAAWCRAQPRRLSAVGPVSNLSFRKLFYIRRCAAMSIAQKPTPRTAPARPGSSHARTSWSSPRRSGGIPPA
jgi:hypothetical protein